MATPRAAADEDDGEVGSDDDAIWESGDVGGFECYIAADESGEDEGPDAEYDDEDDTKLLSVSASNNTLSLVFRDPGTMRFVKYVGSGAPSSRFDIALEYAVDAEDDDDSDDGKSDDTEKWRTNKFVLKLLNWLHLVDNMSRDTLNLRLYLKLSFDRSNEAFTAGDCSS